MDKITERDSENVTSARHRIFNEEHGDSSHYEEIKYRRWERPSFERERESYLKQKNNFIPEIKRDVEEPQTFSGRRSGKSHEEGHRNYEIPMEYRFINSM